MERAGFFQIMQIKESMYIKKKLPRVDLQVLQQPIQERITKGSSSSVRSSYDFSPRVVLPVCRVRIEIISFQA